MITFKGYSNIITNDIKMDVGRVAFISMQLNNDGAQDLTELRNTNKMSFIENNSDVLSLVYSKFEGRPERLFFNGKSLYLGDELLKLGEECGDNYNYQREEKASMKAYTLMASLTKRMMNNSNFNVDEGFARVFKDIFMFLLNPAATNFIRVNAMLQDSIQFGEPLKNTASFFNEVISQNMKKFFRV